MAATDETPAAFPWKPSARDCVPLLFLFGRAVATLAGLRHGCHHAVIAALTTTVSFGELRAKKKTADWTTRPKITSVSLCQVLPSVHGSSETHRHCNRLFEIAAIGDVHDAAFEHSAGRAMNMADSQRRRDADVQM